MRPGKTESRATWRCQLCRILLRTGSSHDGTRDAGSFCPVLCMGSRGRCTRKRNRHTEPGRHGPGPSMLRRTSEIMNAGRACDHKCNGRYYSYQKHSKQRSKILPTYTQKKKSPTRATTNITSLPARSANRTLEQPPKPSKKQALHNEAWEKPPSEPCSGRSWPIYNPRSRLSNPLSS
jgi:hypothetical protein